MNICIPDPSAHEWYGNWLQVLQEIAEYIPPDMNSSGGKFKLRKELIDEFDPFSVKMSSPQLANAYANAQQAGWDPASMLIPLPPPPPGLSSLYQDLGSPTLMRCSIILCVIFNPAFNEQALASYCQEDCHTPLGC